MKINYLGPVNSYSYLAAKKIKSGQDELAEYPTFFDVAYNIKDNKTSGILPIENSIEGAVGNTLDILAWDSDLYITKEICLNINHKLIMMENADFNCVRRIITHSQAYGQCRKYMAKHYPGAEVIYTSSTSRAVECLNDDITAAIAGEHNLKPGLKALNDIIQSNPYNVTRFVCLEKEPSESPYNHKISLIFDADNKPGGLLKILQVLDAYKINMTKIESRPLPKKMGNYIFFVDLVGNAADDSIRAALKEIEKITSFYKYLGNYRTV